jgi:hypothetical protein
MCKFLGTKTQFQKSSGVFLQNYQGQQIFRIFRIIFLLENQWNRSTVCRPGLRRSVYESTESLNESRRFSDLRPRFKTQRGTSHSNLGCRLTRGRRQALLLSWVARPGQSSGGTIAGGSGELKLQLRCTKRDEVSSYTI